MSVRREEAKLEKINRPRYFTKKKINQKVLYLALLTSFLTFQVGFPLARSVAVVLGVLLLPCLGPSTCCSLCLLGERF